MEIELGELAVEKSTDLKKKVICIDTLKVRLVESKKKYKKINKK